MIGEILGKALVVVKGDTAHARAEIAKLSAAEQAAAKARVKAQEESNAAFERSNQKFGLYVAGAAAGWAVISSSVKKYEEHLKSLGASGEEELKKLQNVTGSLSKAQDNLQIAIGKLAIAAAPAVEAFAEMANHLASIVSGIGDIVNAAKNLRIGGYRVGDVVSDAGDAIASGLPGPLGDYARGKDLAAKARLAANGQEFDPRMMAAMTGGSIGETPGAQYGEGAYETRTPEWYRAMGWRLQSTGVWLPPLPKDRRSGAARRDPYSSVWRDVINPAISATSGASRGGADVGYGRDLTDEELLGLAGMNAKGGDFGQFGEYDFPALRKIQESMDRAFGLEEGRRRRESVLESIFGPIEEFELYRTAWQGLEGVVTAGLNAWIDGSKSVSAAMKEALSAQAKQLAGEALLQTLRHGAFALGSLAFGRVDEAAKHGIAAAKWGAVLAVAGTYAKASAPGAGTANANAAAGLGGGTRGGDGGRRSDTTLVFGDAFSQDSPQYVARRTRRNLDNARLYADYLEDA